MATKILSKTKIKFYSSLTPEQFEHYAHKVWTKIRECNRKETKVRLEQEYAALCEFYVELFNIGINSFVEFNDGDYKDWTEDESNFFIIEKIMYDRYLGITQPVLCFLTDDDDDALNSIAFKVVTPERFQWMVNHYPEKMIMIWNNPVYKLKTNPLYKNIKWPKKLKEEKKLVDDLASIGL